MDTDAARMSDMFGSQDTYIDPSVIDRLFEPSMPEDLPPQIAVFGSDPVPTMLYRSVRAAPVVIVTIDREEPSYDFPSPPSEQVRSYRRERSRPKTNRWELARLRRRQKGKRARKARKITLKRR